MPRNSEKNNMLTFYSLKQTTWEMKFFSQTLDGWALTLLKRPHQRTIIYNENSQRTKSKSFIARDYDYSGLDKPNPTHKQHHQNGKLTTKLLYNMITCTPEHGCPNTKRLFSTMAHMSPIIISAHHPKSQ